MAKYKKLKLEERIEVKRSKTGKWQMATVDSVGDDMHWSAYSAKFDFAAACDKTPSLSWFYNYADEGKTWRRFVDLNEPLKKLEFVKKHATYYTTINGVKVVVFPMRTYMAAEVPVQHGLRVIADGLEDAAVGAYAAYAMMQRRKA